MEEALAVEAVSKRFGCVQALSGVSLRLAPGEALAVTGENGAGKTTLAKIVMGLVEADSGRVSLCGLDVRSPGEAGALAGFVPGEDRSLFLRLSALENLRYEAGLRGIPASRFEARLQDLSGTFELDGLLGRKTADLSAGQRQRVVLARASIHDPPLLVLDEPSRSLDARMSRRLWDFLLAGRARGKAVLLCTHRPEEAEAVCDRAVELKNGAFP